MASRLSHERVLTQTVEIFSPTHRWEGMLFTSRIFRDETQEPLPSRGHPRTH